MKHIEDRISLSGHPTYIVPKLGHNFASIPKAARVVHKAVLEVVPKYRHIVPHIQYKARRVREIIDKHNAENVVLVAHSKGGLIGKYVLIHFNQDKKIKGMVAIATPFSGFFAAELDLTVHLIS